ncbi:MAG: hypothetical protein B7X91_11440 [Hydrogenophilales bacterium 17-64-11]|nr:MAG: hypothetical protein B7X91_11440 [Hydrogenophilales bacterium 17-64-11]
MSSMLELVCARPHVSHVDNERELGNGIIVTLRDGFYFSADPGCGVRGFDSAKEAEQGTRSARVYKA